MDRIRGAGFNRWSRKLVKRFGSARIGMDRNRKEKERKSNMAVTV